MYLDIFLFSSEPTYQFGGALEEIAAMNEEMEKVTLEQNTRMESNRLRKLIKEERDDLGVMIKEIDDLKEEQGFKTYAESKIRDLSEEIGSKQAALRELEESERTNFIELQEIQKSLRVEAEAEESEENVLTGGETSAATTSTTASASASVAGENQAKAAHHLRTSAFSVLGLYEDVQDRFRDCEKSMLESGFSPEGGSIPKEKLGGLASSMVYLTKRIIPIQKAIREFENSTPEKGELPKEFSDALTLARATLSRYVSGMDYVAHRLGYYMKENVEEKDLAEDVKKEDVTKVLNDLSSVKGREMEYKKYGEQDAYIPLTPKIDFTKRNLTEKEKDVLGAAVKLGWTEAKAKALEAREEVYRELPEAQALTDAKKFAKEANKEEESARGAYATAYSNILGKTVSADGNVIANRLFPTSSLGAARSVSPPQLPGAGGTGQDDDLGGAGVPSSPGGTNPAATGAGDIGRKVGELIKSTATTADRLKEAYGKCEESRHTYLLTRPLLPWLPAPTGTFKDSLKDLVKEMRNMDGKLDKITELLSDENAGLTNEQKLTLDLASARYIASLNHVVDHMRGYIKEAGLASEAGLTLIYEDNYLYRKRNRLGAYKSTELELEDILSENQKAALKTALKAVSAVGWTEFKVAMVEAKEEAYSRDKGVNPEVKKAIRTEVELAAKRRNDVSSSYSAAMLEVQGGMSGLQASSGTAGEDQAQAVAEAEVEAEAVAEVEAEVEAVAEVDGAGNAIGEALAPAAPAAAETKAASTRVEQLPAGLINLVGKNPLIGKAGGTSEVGMAAIGIAAVGIVAIPIFPPLAICLIAGAAIIGAGAGLVGLTGGGISRIMENVTENGRSPLPAHLGFSPKTMEEAINLVQNLDPPPHEASLGI